jgi:hypothetical protein
VKRDITMMPVRHLLTLAHLLDSGVVDHEKVATYARQMRDSGYDAQWADDNDDHIRLVGGDRLVNGNHRVHAAAQAGLSHLPVEKIR